MIELLMILLIVLALVALNGLFVAAEFAIISSPRTAMVARAEAGDRRAKAVALTLEDPNRLDRYVATAQLGITFASLGLGMYGEHQLAHLFEGWLAALGLSETGASLTSHGLASVLAIGLITYLHIVLGEMIPKALALSQAQQVALWVNAPMRVIGLLLFPLVHGLNRAGILLLRLVGVERAHSAQHYLNPDELELVARESQLGGLLSEETGRVFRELADFSEVTAEQAMVPRVFTQGLPIDASDAQLREILKQHRHTRYPVYRGDLDHILGTVHIKDLLGLLREGRGLDPAVVRETAYLPETATLDDVLAGMAKTRNQMIVVMDEHGGTAGILTIEDICVEAIGEIEEGADDVPDVRPVGPDRYQVEGTLRLDRLGDVIERELEHPEVETVSGLILSELGRPPRKGDRIQWNDLLFEVVRVHGHGVKQALLTLRATPPTA
ncbi:Hemolysin C [Thiorhodovibrio winogradskyi]|uniref:Hemolysin C n=1 Tax=Thiorhodovibrio winogradskyi TaxID=77007 RepID=A0ABZ0SBN3_9GAMM|nr:hemolysin family protein [Thiorhodovibrio winogradskyi]